MKLNKNLETRTKKLRKTEEVQEELTTSLFDERDETENKKLTKKLQMWGNVIVIVAKYTKILKMREKYIVRIASRQGYILGKFKESNKFKDMITQLEISKSIMNFKINLFKFKYPRFKKSSL